MKLSDLLVSSGYIQLKKELAVMIGLEQAAILQTVINLSEIGNCGRPIEGERWIYNTYEQWQKDFFPFWSVITIKRAFIDLEKMGLLISRQLPGANRQKYYRPVAGYMDKVLDMPPRQDRRIVKGKQGASYQSDTMNVSARYAPITKNHAKNLPNKTPVPVASAPSEHGEVIKPPNAAPDPEARIPSLATNRRKSESDPQPPVRGTPFSRRRFTRAQYNEIVESLEFHGLDLDSLWERLVTKNFRDPKGEPIQSLRAYLMSLSETITNGLQK